MELFNFISEGKEELKDALKNGFYVAEARFDNEIFGPAYVKCTEKEAKDLKAIARFVKEEIHVSVELVHVRVLAPNEKREDEPYEI